MREVQLGAHTVRSHGFTVARTHMHDWLILLLLVVVEIILYLIHPFYQFVGKDMMGDLKYPLKDNTVPVWAVPIYAILLPMVVFYLVYYRRRDVYDLQHAILGLLFSVLITAVMTDAIKDAVGRPRPDFFWHCFPDGKDVCISPVCNRARLVRENIFYFYFQYLYLFTKRPFIFIFRNMFFV